MELTTQCHHYLVNDFIKHLSSHLDDLDNDAKTLSLCSDFKNYYSAVVKTVTHTATLDWKFVTNTLCLLSSLKKVFSILIVSDSSLSKACLSIFPFNMVMEDLFSLSASKELSLSYCAQSTLTYLVLKVKISPGCVSFKETFHHFWSIITSRKSDDTVCHFELLQMFLKQMKCENIKVSDSLYGALLGFCRIHLSNIEREMRLTSSRAKLKLIKEILQQLPRSNSLFKFLLDYVTNLFKRVDFCSLQPDHRLVVLQIISSFFKFSPLDCGSEICLDAATCFLQSVLNENLCQYFLKEPKFVGFGGRLVLSAQNLPEDEEGFSTAEKMLLLNNVMSALHISSVSQCNWEVFVRTEMSLIVMLGLSSSNSSLTGSIFDIFLEQDDSMIEFLLLHLILFVFAER